MKLFCTAFFFILLFGCDQPPASATGESAAAVAQNESTGSFKLANREIREEALQLLDDADIEYWVGDDGAINYNLVDGEEIDKIGNDVILTYIRRN